MEKDVTLTVDSVECFLLPLKSAQTLLLLAGDGTGDERA
jgi:hypothetical protein